MRPARSRAVYDATIAIRTESVTRAESCVPAVVITVSGYVENARKGEVTKVDFDSQRILTVRRHRRRSAPAQRRPRRSFRTLPLYKHVPSPVPGQYRVPLVVENEVASVGA